MALTGRARNGAARIRRSSWETRVAVGAPVLIAALTVPIMLGAFSAAQEGTNGTGTASYGPAATTTLPAPPTTTAVAGTGAGTGTTGAGTTGAAGAGTSTAPVEANPQTAG